MIAQSCRSRARGVCGNGGAGFLPHELLLVSVCYFWADADLITDAWTMDEDESVFPAIDIAALAVARDCRFGGKRGAPDATYRVPITFDPRRR